MVKRRCTSLLVLASLSATIFWATLLLKDTDISSFYPHVPSNDFQVRSLNEVSLPETENVKQNRCLNGDEYGEYCVISPYAKETRNTSSASLVTLCTQGTIEFLKHVAVLCRRWSSPISVAVYSPQEDYGDARNLVQQLRQCDSCIRYWVNWHFFFPKQTELPTAHEYQLTATNCTDLGHVNVPKKRRSQGTYPINVGRNLARRLANTPYVFSIDIELYPSLNIPAKFERMIRSKRSSLDNQVWVVPVFEVRSKHRAPLFKFELRSLFNRKVVISFHQFRCSICHKIPNLTQWMALENGSISEVEDSLETMKVWTTVKRSREFKLQFWEPFFIGTNREPEFDVRLSWEGKQNKMQVAYEMCMKNYDFHVVENAFLVHAPGINVYNASKEKEREKHLVANQRVITSAKKKLIQKYGNKNKC